MCSTPLFVPSIGLGATADQVLPPGEARLAAQAERAGDRGSGPRQATVGGSVHLHHIAGPGVVVLDVAVAVVWAGRPGVARDPALVEERAGVVGGRDRVAPRQPAVCRAA